MARLRDKDAKQRAASGYGPDFLEAFARGLRVIAAFGREKKQMTLSDVARAARSARGDRWRALYTLTCLGLAAVLDGYDIVMIAHSMHGRPDVLAPTIGIRRPAFNTAAGRAILSQLTDAALDAWLDKLEPKEMTKFTVTDKKALRAEILHVREQGYAVTAQELRRGYHAVAVPLRRFDGATIAAVCVAVWLEDSSVGTSAEKYLTALREETETLQAQLL